MLTLSIDDYRDWHKEGKLEPEKSFDFFTNLRVSQMREMQEQASIDAKIPSFDFGHIWEGLQQYQDKVHPLIVRFPISFF